MLKRTERATPATGPLQVLPANPRYFTDGSGKAIYLTGAHTWANFRDRGSQDPPQAFNYDAYLNALVAYNHNFIRLWAADLTQDSYPDSPALSFRSPFPWLRTGPGTALDHKPEFDLAQFNTIFFDRLWHRVDTARQKGIYVSIMLFEGYGPQFAELPWNWHAHPFNPANNINLDGIVIDTNGDSKGLELYTLEHAVVTELQKAYVRKVIDTVNELDNVLYEIANENGAYSTAWQYEMINYIKSYEAGKPKQHPVGMTFQHQGGTNKALFDSPADWISPNEMDGYRDDPPAADGSKVIISDTDHLWGIGGNAGWVWKSFTRGLNPVFMDPYYIEEHRQYPSHPEWEPIRRAMGDTLSYAQRMNLATMVPRKDLASTGYCLANPGVEYLVFLPFGSHGMDPVVKLMPYRTRLWIKAKLITRTVKVNLSGTSGSLRVEWFSTITGKVIVSDTITKGGRQDFTAPFPGEVVLYLTAQ